MLQALYGRPKAEFSAGRTDKVRIIVTKSERRLILLSEGRALLDARVALGRAPEGPKRRQGDGRTPEGLYRVCLVKPNGKYGKSLGLSYPNAGDARRAFAERAIDADELRAIESAEAEGRRPPWGTALGGEIYLHEGPVDADWTQGCVALAPEDMARLFACADRIEAVEIRP
jgi:murein L,D-transpeptidase YafK